MKPITAVAAALAAATLALGAPALAQMNNGQMNNGQMMDHGQMMNDHAMTDEEMRDQMRHMPANGLTLSATLRGRAEVPRADRDGTGRFWARVNPGRGQVCYTLTSSRLDRLTMAHIHRGMVGVSGPPVVTLRARSPRQSCVTVDRRLAMEIAHDPSAFYVNVHTVRYPGGAIRGQLRR